MSSNDSFDELFRDRSMEPSSVPIKAFSSLEPTVYISRTSVPTTFVSSFFSPEDTNRNRTKIAVNITFDSNPELIRWDISKVSKPKSNTNFPDEVIQSVDYNCDFTRAIRRNYNESQLRSGVYLQVRGCESTFAIEY